MSRTTVFRMDIPSGIYRQIRHCFHIFVLAENSRGSFVFLYQAILQSKLRFSCISGQYCRSLSFFLASFIHVLLTYTIQGLIPIQEKSQNIFWLARQVLKIRNIEGNLKCLPSFEAQVYRVIMCMHIGHLHVLGLKVDRASYTITCYRKSNNERSLWMLRCVKGKFSTKNLCMRCSRIAVLAAWSRCECLRKAIVCSCSIMVYSKLHLHDMSEHA